MASTHLTRYWWHLYRCSPGVERPEGFFGRSPVYEQEVSHDAVSALEQGHLGSGYLPENDGWISSKRWCPWGIAGAICSPSGSGCSLHNYCAAYDIEYNYNKYIRARITPEDFDEEWFTWICKYTLDQVYAIEGIKNIYGEQIWKWLGWAIGDTMHWQINVPPERMQVDWNTVPDMAVEDSMNLKMLVQAAFDAGNPAVQGNIDHWLDLADSDPMSDEWYDLFRAMLTPAHASVNVEYVQVVKDIS